MKAINKTMAVLAFSVASILISPAAAFSNEIDTLDEIMNIGYSLEENILSGIQDYMYSAYGDRYELDDFGNLPKGSFALNTMKDLICSRVKLMPS